MNTPNEIAALRLVVEHSGDPGLVNLIPVEYGPNYPITEFDVPAALNRAQSFLSAVEFMREYLNDDIDDLKTFVYDVGKQFYGKEYLREFFGDMYIKESETRSSGPRLWELIEIIGADKFIVLMTRKIVRFDPNLSYD